MSIKETEPSEARRHLSLAEQDAQHFGGSPNRVGAKPDGRQVAEGVGKDDIRVVRDTLNLRHFPRTRDERLRTDDGRRESGLLEGYSVVHTAR